MTKYSDDTDTIAKVSRGFAKRSNGVLIGEIGAIDVWLVQILLPSWIRDAIKIPPHSSP